MSTSDATFIDKARECWLAGQSIEAGRLIFENLPNNTRPKWAFRILDLVVKRSGLASPLLDNALYTASTPDMWWNGHRVFDNLRRTVLQLDELERTNRITDQQVCFRSILCLAELVAKVTYNATDPADEFDSDSGWWIAVSLRGFVENRWIDDEFAIAAWTTLVRMND